MLIFLPFLLIGIVIFGVVISKNISRKISQLSSQNRLLKALRSLDIVALSTTEVEPLCQAIVDVIHKELGYTFAVIALIDNKIKGIRRVAISLEPKSAAILREIVPIQFKEQIVPFAETRNLFNKVVAEKKERISLRI